MDRLPAACPPRPPSSKRLARSSERLHDIAGSSWISPIRVGSGFTHRWLTSPPDRRTAGFGVATGSAAIRLERSCGAFPSLQPTGSCRVEFGVRFPDTDTANASPFRRRATSRSASSGTPTDLAASIVRRILGLLRARGGAQYPSVPDSARLVSRRRQAHRSPRSVQRQLSVICASAQVAGSGAEHVLLIVFFRRSPMFKVPASGGTPVPIRITGKLEPAFPQFLADQRHLIFYDGPPRGNGSIRVSSVDGGEATLLTRADGPGVFAPPNHLLFIRGAALMAQPLNPERRTLTGEPKVLVANASLGTLFAFRANVSASATGVLAFARPRGGSAGQLTWFDARASRLARCHRRRAVNSQSVVLSKRRPDLA